MLPCELYIKSEILSHQVPDTSEQMRELVHAIDCCVSKGRIHKAKAFLALALSLKSSFDSEFSQSLNEFKKKCETINESREPLDNENINNTLPSLRERASSFSKAIIRHAADKFAKCDELEIQSRLSICEICPKLQNGWCTVCGCACQGEGVFLNKLAWKSEKCPEGKW